MSTETTDTDDVLRELASLPSLLAPTVGPDGEQIAVYYDVTGRNELHLLDPETGDLEQLSDGEVPRAVRAGFEWHPDGDRLFFHRDEAGDEQHDIHQIDLDGETEPVVEMDGQCRLQAVGDDGETLLFASSAGDQLNLYRHDVPTGETTKLTDYERAASGGLLSPDCEQIAFTTNETDDYDNQDVYVADRDGEDVRVLDIGDTGAETAPVDFGPDGERLLVSDNTTDVGRSGVYDLETDEVTWFGGDGFDESPDRFLADGERFVADRSRDSVQVPVVYDVETGEATELELDPGVSGLLGEPLADGRQVVYHTAASTRATLLTYDLDDDETTELLQAEYGPFSPSDFVEPETIRFDSDGVPETPARAVEHEPAEEYEIQGLLFDSGVRPSPLIVNPHGGPRARDLRRFSYRTQFLLSRGFSVLQVNYRGSTGRGREFVRSLYDDWGGAEQGDVAIGVEHVLSEYDWIDDDRIVVYGGSYGGFSTNWQVVQYPDLYDAAVTSVGLSDLVDMYENTMPHFRTELMVKNLGTPDENPTLYEERSPVEHVENLDCPLLIVHGVNDPRVPVSQARILRDALEESGFEAGSDGDFEYEELGEEGHGSSDIDQKIRSLELLDDFLDRRIGTEEAPVASLDD
ncbi:prolyl oligopeptidase family serine peptidase [Halobaculum sp. MBLA0143]|uniref:S9 family peptidase n=1 Tax=Halobaculum sp. MBLA0143 TaxID=3079933 RepID=UPI003526B80C